MARAKAFLLVELSIVLVILGLLAGGILSGQSLIRAAEIRSITTDVQRYTAAVYSFRDKYMAIPGDMANATKFWTAEDADPATCRTTESKGNATCDGNGNGIVFDCSYEMFRFWQHLANAGLIEGSYTGVEDGEACNHTLGKNAPKSRIANAGFSYSYLDLPNGDALIYGLNYRNIFWFGTDSGDRTQTPAL